MAAYATVEQLAVALRIQVTATNTVLLQDCLDAAAGEIDFEVDLKAGGAVPDPVPTVVGRTNVNRAVEWYKAADAAYGVIGYEQVGVLYAPKDGFARHAVNLGAVKEQWGVT